MLMEACRGDLVHESAQSSGLQRNDHLPALQRSDLAAGFAVERAEQLCGGLCNGANSPRDNSSSQLCEAVHGAGERSLLGLRALASRCISIQLGKSQSSNWLRTWQGSVPLPLRMGPRWVRCVLERRQPPLPADSAELHRGCRVQRCRPNPQSGSSRPERTLSDFEGTLPLHREL